MDIINQSIGTKKERDRYTEVMHHYRMSQEDLDSRKHDWDKKDELFQSYIDENKWPYASTIFVPLTFTSLYEKQARLIGGKPRGRLIPREGGDILKAKINNEVLSFQWDDSSRVEDLSMIAKWAMMDLNARKYGASFALVKWRYETNYKGEVIYDGPTMQVINSRDALGNPGYSYIKNWFQVRSYSTIKDLERINDVSKVKPIYKNIGLLKKIITGKDSGSILLSGGDQRDSNYIPRTRTIRGLQDYLGKDEAPDFKVVEIITEYRADRVIVFAPKHGIILRDDPNPYEHGQIPVVQLKYMAIDDDLYGLSESDPTDKIQKGINALSSQYVDAANMELYRILKVGKGVQMDTLEWGPGKKWRMNSPSDVVPLEQSSAISSQFTNAYSILTSMFKEGMGETSAAFSTMQPGSKDKTATEIRSLETTRSVRDNFNQIFLSEAIQKQTMLWLSMNKQFIFSDPEKNHIALSVVNRDVLKDFMDMGLNDEDLDLSDEELYMHETSILEGQVPEIQGKYKYPVNINGVTKPKLEIDERNETGTLYIEKSDMDGYYDYIVDVEPMRSNNSLEERRALNEAIGLMLNPQALSLLQQENKKPKLSELLVSLFDLSGLKGADKFFEAMETGNEPADMAQAQTNGQPTQPNQEIRFDAGGVGESSAGGFPS